MTTAAPRVLVVDDEETILHAVLEALTARGFHAIGRPSGADFATAVRGFRPDLAILDVMLPGSDGFNLARQLQTVHPTPVLFLTARTAPSDVLRGFDNGADDYVTKPFLVEELLARVTAILKRVGRLQSTTMQVGDLVVDESAAVARRGATNLDLTATELRLLVHFVRTPGRVWSKTQLLSQVWGYESYDPNLVEVHVSSLRRKLEVDGAPRLLHTVRGLGYTIRAEVPDA